MGLSPWGEGRGALGLGATSSFSPSGSVLAVCDAPCLLGIISASRFPFYLLLPSAQFQV
jgi:hypothetical protein